MKPFTCNLIYFLPIGVLSLVINGVAVDIGIIGANRPGPRQRDEPRGDDGR